LLSSQELPLLDDKSCELLLEATVNALPHEHPLRDECVSSALLAMQPLLAEKELVLVWSRDYCSLAESTSVKSSSLTTKALAREMLKRKLQRLIIIPEVSMKDLGVFLEIVTTEPENVFAAGGIEAVMLKSGITTIFANEINLSLLRGLANDGNEYDLARLVAAGGDEEPTLEEPPPEEEVENPVDIQFSVLGIDIILGMLKAETRENPFIQLA